MAGMNWIARRWSSLRTWLAVRLGLWRGRWQVLALEARVARWTWWPWPWSGHVWSAALYHPPGLAATEAAPLLVLLHGCRQQATGFAQASGWVRAADRGRFRLLCPQQREGANPFGCWNWFHPPAQAGAGELDVVLQALAQVRARWPSGGVAVVGLSSGAGLAALLAFHHADEFCAAAVVAGPPLLGRGNLQDPRAVLRSGLAVSPRLATLLLRDCAPMLVLQGEDDPVVAPVCAEQLATQVRTVAERAHGPLQAQAPGPAGLDWTATGRLRLRLQRVPGLGHVWSGAPGGHAHVAREGPDLTRMVLAFLDDAAQWPGPDTQAARPG